MEEPREIGKWAMICVLGAGAFGKVTLWRNTDTDEHVAVKKCKFKLPKHLSNRQRERWVNEVDIIKSMKNDNIVQYKQLPESLEIEFEKFNPTGLPLLPMEYCSKGNLRRFLAQPKNLKGCKETDVRCILKDVTNAILYLHSRNITHRDIKPENIVIQECDNRQCKNLYKLIDLGYAKELETIASFVGTLPYLAPEIFLTQSYNYNVDYWSLGILAYEIITGEHPFLPNKTPVERFKYLKDKSDEHICISISMHGKVKFSQEITLETRLSPIFKKDIEFWLKLLLAYDSNKRGFYNNEKKNIFIELESILNKKMLKVFSVFNYQILVYEITEDTRLMDVKQLLERDTLIPSQLQMFIINIERVISDEDTRIIDLYEENSEKLLYIFKKNSSFEPRIVTIPQQVQELFGPVNKISNLSKKLAHVIFFINEEKELLETFCDAVIHQTNYVNYCFNEQKIMYNNVRNDLIRMLVQIDCFYELNRCQTRYISCGSQEYVRCLHENRTYLQQARELTENFNSLTERFLDNLKLAWVCNHTEFLKNALGSSKTAMTGMYDKALTDYQKLDSFESPVQEITETVNKVLKIPRQAIFKNANLDSYLRSTLLAQRKLTKLYIWTNAISNEIKKVSSLICNCEKAKYECVQSTRTPVSSIKVPDDLDAIEINQLLGENQNLRYRIQDVSSEGSAYLRGVQRDMLYFWNGVIFPTSQS